MNKRTVQSVTGFITACSLGFGVTQVFSHPSNLGPSVVALTIAVFALLIRALVNENS